MAAGYTGKQKEKRDGRALQRETEEKKGDGSAAKGNKGGKGKIQRCKGKQRDDRGTQRGKIRGEKGYKRVI